MQNYQVDQSTLLSHLGRIYQYEISQSKLQTLSRMNAPGDRER